MTGRQLTGGAVLLLYSLAAGAELPPWSCAGDADNTWNCDSGTGMAVLAQADPDEPELPLTPSTITTGDDMPSDDVAAPPNDSAMQESTTPAVAQDSSAGRQWGTCPPPPASGLLTQDAPAAGITELRADSVAVSADRVFVLQGDATIVYGNQSLRANDITYRKSSGEIEAGGGIRLTGPNLDVSGDSALLLTGEDRGSIDHLTYRLPQQHVRGSADLLNIEGAGRLHLEKATYTTCPEGNRDWQLSAKTVDLDHGEGTGVARDAKITFKGAPLLYTPYISFPLDDRRKSGLLFPRIGTSEQTGIDISQPVYWNIAPNRDATITPRLMTDRGKMLGAEYRFLNRNNNGIVSGEYLFSDDRFDQQDRYLATLNFNSSPNPDVELLVRASGVSDQRYFEDLSSDLVETSQTHLERTASAAYYGNNWKASLLLQGFQNLDATLASSERPYQQLPRMTFDYHPEQRLLGVAMNLGAEINVFTHSDSTLVKGTRFDIQPRFSVPLHTAGWYVEPALGVRYTAYTLDNTAAGADDSPTRTTPLAILDAGAVFERQSSWGNTAYFQTLEPRLYYLYVAERNQDDLPVFDTGNYDFNYWSLFRDNRFNGPDRMGDANQLALALTSRFTDPDTGQQMFRVSAGSLLYFRDRTVTLPGENVALDNSSDLIGELSMVLTRHWNARAEVVWNPHVSQTARSNYRVQYRGNKRRLANIGYRFRDGLQEQTDLSFVWPMSSSWYAVGRWYYDLDTSQTIDALAGLGYERCCWGAQLVARNYINRDGLERTSAIYLQLELKGLGKLGSSLDEALERDILGYSSSF